jgi:DNA repair exonuclease SbcCD ATPase subunit
LSKLTNYCEQISQLTISEKLSQELQGENQLLTTELQGEKQMSQTQSENQKNRIKSLQYKLQEKENKISELQEKKDELEDKNNSKQQELIHKDNEIIDLKKQIEDLEIKNNQLEDNIEKEQNWWGKWISDLTTPFDKVEGHPYKSKFVDYLNLYKEELSEEIINEYRRFCYSNYGINFKIAKTSPAEGEIVAFHQSGN